ncbi:hypothetical protein BOW52_05645 [Solemya elarraichensis gill symbiont]|uniref:Type 4 fimbrial biogenesis protein PilX N-terminal domain-containing protein n=2 Tax=Solemya elarraichensis gill symbiont TaxID=1918949 RepID=A0A1T2L6F8_9GAMM|nr:hypothetical protein BOW52_05645 [Solemya elarraichensis gill symbiont]
MVKKEMKQKQKFRSIKRQDGIAVLVIALIMLLLMTMLAFISSNSVRQDITISNNDFRIRQAFQAAEAGLSFAEAHYIANIDDYDTDGDGTIDSPSEYPGGESTPEVGEYYNNDGESNPGFSYDEIRFAAGSDNVLYIESRGWSDDGTTERTLSNYLSLVPLVNTPPASPLTVRGAVDVTAGGVSVENAFGNITIRSGGVTETGSAFKTRTCNDCGSRYPDTYGNPSEGGPSNPLPGMWLTDTGAGDEADVTIFEFEGGEADPTIIMNDPYLDLEADEFFKRYMGGTMEEVKGVMTIYTSSDDIDGIEGQAMWLDTEGDEYDLKDSVGSRDNPVVLVVEGDMKTSANFVLFGMLFVTGEADFSGGGELYGSMVVMAEGFNPGTGGGVIYYDPLTASGGGAGGGAGGSIGGTWRDWGN